MLLEVSIIDENPEFDVQVFNIEKQEREETLERTFETKQLAVDYVKTLVNNKAYLVTIRDETAAQQMVPVVTKPTQQEPVTKEILEGILSRMSPTQNIGVSDKLSELKTAVLSKLDDANRLYAPLTTLDFGQVHVEPVMSLYLDKNDIPTMIFDVQFFNLGLNLPIEAKHKSSWVYFPGKLGNLKG